jgi:hypothetical protein
MSNAFSSRPYILAVALGLILACFAIGTLSLWHIRGQDTALRRELYRMAGPASHDEALYWYHEALRIQTRLNRKDSEN